MFILSEWRRSIIFYHDSVEGVEAVWCVEFVLNYFCAPNRSIPGGADALRDCSGEDTERVEGFRPEVIRDIS